MPRKPRVQYPGAIYHVMSRETGARMFSWTIKSIAARLHLKTSRSANVRLHGWMGSDALSQRGQTIKLSTFYLTRKPIFSQTPPHATQTKSSIPWRYLLSTIAETTVGQVSWPGRPARGCFPGRLKVLLPGFTWGPLGVPMSGCMVGWGAMRWQEPKRWEHDEKRTI